MSVVNQMLRDLDARQATPDVLQVEPAVSIRSNIARRRNLWLIGVGVAIVCAAAIAVTRAPGGAITPTAAPAIAMTSASTAHSNALQPAAVGTSVRSKAHADGPGPMHAAASSGIRSALSTESTATPVAAAPNVAAASTPVSPRLGGATNAVKPATESRPVPSAPPVEHRATVVATAKPAASLTTNEPTRIEKRMLDQGTESADAAFRRAAGLIEKGRITDAKIALNAALAANPDHAAARQTLAALLIEARALDEAQATLTEGLARDAGNSNFAIVLARLQLERGDQSSALELLTKHRAAGAANAQYRAFHAALLRRAGRHAEAADEYLAALRQAPGVGAWWVGLALSHEANERDAEAMHAFRQARASGALTAELADLVERKLRGTP